MRLVRLYSDRFSFNQVNFNPRGITLIEGRQDDQNASTLDRTYNGVGKSLIVHLIHFCLGRDAAPELATSLPNWTFYLEVEIGDKPYLISRNTESQSKINLNLAEHSISDFKKEMERLSLGDEISTPYITFRSILKRFIRPSKAAYARYDLPSEREMNYSVELHKAYLIGFNPIEVQRKKDIRKQIDENTKSISSLKKLDIYKDFNNKPSDALVKLETIRSKIARIETDLSVFRIAENYNEVQFEIDQARSELRRLTNDLFIVENNINSLQESMNRRADISLDQVESIYKEIGVNFNGQLQKSLAEVNTFHMSMLDRRIKKLTSDIVSEKKSQKILQEKIEEQNRTLNSKLKYLSEHSSMQEFQTIQNKKSELMKEEQRISDYLDQIRKFENKKRALQFDLLTSNSSAQKYLDSIVTTTSAASTLFRSLVEPIYPNKVFGLTFEVDDKDGQNQFFIDAMIEADDADGINQIKIFCFDTTLLFLQTNHQMKFVFHDSRLFNDIDPRQRSMIFKIAHEEYSSRDLQYIASVNQHQINDPSFTTHFSTEEYKSIISNNITLTLTDESPETKLLGANVEIRFEV